MARDACARGDRLTGQTRRRRERAAPPAVIIASTRKKPITRAWLVGIAASVIARRDRSRDEPSARSAAFAEAALGDVGCAPYVEDVATVASAFAVDGVVPFRARVAIGGRGKRCSPRTPGAVGPLAVGMSSTYWVTDEVSGGGEVSCARAASALLAAKRATATIITPARPRRAPSRSFPESTRSTTQ
jgi:hypothetical protein